MLSSRFLFLRGSERARWSAARPAVLSQVAQPLPRVSPTPTRYCHSVILHAPALRVPIRYKACKHVLAAQLNSLIITLTILILIFPLPNFSPRVSLWVRPGEHMTALQETFGLQYLSTTPPIIPKAQSHYHLFRKKLILHPNSLILILSFHPCFHDHVTQLHARHLFTRKLLS